MPEGREGCGLLAMSVQYPSDSMAQLSHPSVPKTESPLT
jgi:hypothetical protein